MPSPAQFDMQFRFDDRDFSRRIDRAIAAGREQRPALEAIGELGLSSIHKNFVHQGRPRAWKPLSAATLYARIGGMGAFKASARRRREYSAAGLKKPAARRMAGMKILIGSGRLLRSIKWRIVSHLVEIGTNLVYSRILHKGGKAGRGHAVTIPPREYVMWQDEDVHEIRRILVEHFFGRGIFDLGGLRF